MTTSTLYYRPGHRGGNGCIDRVCRASVASAFSHAPSADDERASLLNISKTNRKKRMVLGTDAIGTYCLCHLIQLRTLVAIDVSLVLN